jgi:hypothetical protein
VSRKKATWIKIYRGIMNSAVWEDNMRLKAWLYILLETNFADKMTYDHGKAIKVKRGQCLTSLRKIGKMVGCEPKTARRILEQFRDDDMISFEIVPGQYTLVNVHKYKDFQSDNPPKGYTDDYTDDHTDDYTNDITDDYTDDHTDDIQHKNNKNVKKGKKGKEDPVPPEGGPDPDPWAWGGPKPSRWNEDDERSWQNDQSNPNNPRMTRMEIWKFWGESDE